MKGFGRHTLGLLMMAILVPEVILYLLTAS